MNKRANDPLPHPQLKDQARPPRAPTPAILTLNTSFGVTIASEATAGADDDIPSGLLLDRGFPSPTSLKPFAKRTPSSASLRTTLPNSSPKSPTLEIRLKRDYLDQHALSQKGHSKVLTSEDWYVQQATRDVNQAVGRVIRRRHDYGSHDKVINAKCHIGYDPMFKLSYLKLGLIQPDMKMMHL
ncbi:uncharacterized protein LOC120284042 [Dioscorea cayenensis subsp. rotundata]|uniref:Uncharacterized protein LOC120284042 n=1 Tax=Dioscorea cayennensis subsp. rotundata TaxID=55577 RepID=A0AB40D3F6_DIOCR|nr:uncharacterized protein LOC120284042 [Dioscorea cayenensis subsp. rotundata]